MPRIVLPVGFSVGPRYGRDDPAPHRFKYYEISLGADSIELDESEAKVLAAASGSVELHSEYRVSRGSVIAFLQTINDGVEDPAPVFDHLVSIGALVEFDPIDGELGELKDVFTRHRLFPTAQGLGATAEDPQRFRIGHGSEPIAFADNMTFSIWAYARNYRNLWENCADFANDEHRTAEGAEALDRTTEDIARAFARSLPVLVATGAAILDTVTAS